MVLIGAGPAAVLAVDEAYVAWTNPGEGHSGTVWVAPRGGGRPACVGEYSYPPIPSGSVSLRDGYVYWTTFSVDEQLGSILRAPLRGGPGPVETVNRKPEYPYTLVTNETHAYYVPLWLQQVHRVPLAGGPSEVVTEGPGTIGALALDATHVYWSGQAGTVIHRAPLAGGPAVPLFTANGNVSRLVVRGGYVYWVDQQDTVVRRGPVQGGPVEVIAANQDAVPFLATDGVRVYWANYGATIQLRSAPVTGGAVESLLTLQRAGGVAVDGADLYFGGAAAWRLPR